MAKKIIILERNEGAPPGFTVLFWLTVSPARQTYYAKVGKKSLWPGADQDTHRHDVRNSKLGGLHADPWLGLAGAAGTCPHVCERNSLGVS